MNTSPQPSTAAVDAELHAMLRLTLTPGLGPVLIRRLLAKTGSAAAACGLSAAQFTAVHGIGEQKAAVIARALPDSIRLACEEIALADKLGVRLFAWGSATYPKLLRDLPDSHVLLYVKGDLTPADQLAGAGVGSGQCTGYG